MLKSVLFLLAVQICPLFAGFDATKGSVDDLIFRAYTEAGARQDLCDLILTQAYIEDGHLYQIDLQRLFPDNKLGSASEARAYIEIATKQETQIPLTIQNLAKKYQNPNTFPSYSDRYAKAIQTHDVRELQSLDISGYKPATYTLGRILYGDLHEFNVDKDYEQARLYLESALNTQDARLILAEIYERGLGVPIDTDISHNHLSQAAMSNIPGTVQTAHLKLAEISKSTDIILAFNHYVQSKTVGYDPMIMFVFEYPMGNSDRQKLLELAIDQHIAEVKARFALFDLNHNIDILTPLLTFQDQQIRKKAHLRLATHYMPLDKSKAFEHSYHSGQYNVAELSNFVFSPKHTATEAQAILEKAIDLHFEENRARYSLFKMITSGDTLTDEQIVYAENVFAGISYDYLCTQIRFVLEIPISLPKLKKFKQQYSGQSLAIILYNLAIAYPNAKTKALDLAKKYATKMKENRILGAIAFVERNWLTSISYNYQLAECYKQLYYATTNYPDKFKFYHQAIALGANLQPCSLTQQILIFSNQHNCSFDYSAGVILYNSNLPEDNAIFFLNREVNVNPDNPNAYFALATIYLSRSNPDYELGKENLQKLQQVVMKQPKLRPQNHLTIGDFRGVLARQSAYPHESYFYAGGMFFYNNNLMDQAFVLFKWALENDPKNGDAAYMLGTIYSNHKKDPEKTREYFEIASKFGKTEATQWLQKYPKT